ncbi:MAG: hypothetical protein HY769_01150 [Candidatus Stahlbacteria bacterium]|nr:hypothetical protein [Candidatus Stahlbacteria bacterium]
MHIPDCIYLYNGSDASSLNLEEIAEYVKERLGNIEIKVREDFISFHLHTYANILAEKLALSRVRKIDTKEQKISPLQMEVEYERKNLFSKTFGVLYDGFKLMVLFSEMITEKESDLAHCHIILTNQLFGTWDESDCRYHIRVSIYGFPSIISTTGIVEAPAKPREFYLSQRMGADTITLEKEFKGKFIDYNDYRMTEIMKGYVMQALFFHITGNPFCEDRSCRLYNAHWQEEVIHAQIRAERKSRLSCLSRFGGGSIGGSGGTGEQEFCEYHQQVLANIKKGKLG